MAAKAELDRGDSARFGETYRSDIPIHYHKRCRENYINPKNIGKYIKERSCQNLVKTTSNRTQRKNEFKSRQNLPLLQKDKYCKGYNTRETLHRVSTLHIYERIKKAAEVQIKM